MREWTVKKIGEVMNVQRGGSPRPIKKYLTDSPDGLNWIKIGDASETDKYIYETKEKITKDGLHKTRLVEEGDFLLSNSMSFGRPYIMKTRGCIHDGWLVLKDKEKEQINKDFLYYYLSSPVVFAQFDKLAAGSTVRNLNIRLVSSVEIPIPPLPEQKQIVEILDEAFEAIDQATANVEHNIQNSEELFQSKLNEIFCQRGEGWEEKTLEQISLEFGRGRSRHRPRNAEKLFGGEYPFIQTGDVRNAAKYIVDYTQTYNEVGLEQSKLWPKGTLCITIAANIAESAIMDFEGCFPDSIIGVYADPNIASNSYAYYCLQFFKADLQAQGKGSAQDNINLGTFKERYFPFPDKVKQKEIAQKLDTLFDNKNELLGQYQRQLRNLEELKKSILQKAFSGELTANEHVAV